MKGLKLDVERIVKDKAPLIQDNFTSLLFECFLKFRHLRAFILFFL